ncbi:hypothetical protein QTN79_00695 [Candidatus Saccharibacteria bacterium oral taxon 488]|jgi:hypothetical protein
MSEKIHGANPELAKNAGELERSAGEVERSAAEQLERRAEQATGQRHEKLDDARHEALEQAEARQTAETEKLAAPETPRQITKADRTDSYRKTMKKMQSELSPASRTFSKVIHNPAVEKASEAIGGTVARPNLIIAGALGAISSVVVYFIARHYGYVLSGSETIILFGCGWVIGAIIEYARVGFLNKR